MPHRAQTPLSRSSTLSRRYPGSLRSFHSSTHQSEQNVWRPLGTSRLHQRQRLRPFGPLGSAARSAQPPGMTRLVLIEEHSSNYMFFSRMLKKAYNHSETQPHVSSNLQSRDRQGA